MTAMSCLLFGALLLFSTSQSGAADADLALIEPTFCVNDSLSYVTIGTTNLRSSDCYNGCKSRGYSFFGLDGYPSTTCKCFSTIAADSEIVPLRTCLSKCSSLNYGCAGDEYMLSGSAAIKDIQSFVGDSVINSVVNPMLISWNGAKSYPYTTSAQSQVFVPLANDWNANLKTCLLRGYHFMSYSSSNSTGRWISCGDSLTSTAGTSGGADLAFSYLTYDNNGAKTQCSVNVNAYPYVTTCGQTITLSDNYIIGMKAIKTVYLSSDSVGMGSSNEVLMCPASTSCSLSYGVTIESSESVDIGISATMGFETPFWSAEVTLSVNRAFSTTISKSFSATIDVQPQVRTCYPIVDQLENVKTVFITQLAPVGSVKFTNGYDVSLSNLFLKSASLPIISTKNYVKNVRGIDDGEPCG